MKCKKKCINYMEEGCRLLFVKRKQQELGNCLMVATLMILNWKKIEKYEVKKCEKYEILYG